ncbi:uncharacterized protein RHO25_010835 [Cercospora beticola]|uniref:Uncharacterized protein n=1 Tax=Cercospora beticola TaxID=122368 RepID=A0ABZ0P2Z8_CERBT|nr:hypothetical protein RHO25_010835 [Cercospora beticola]
MAGQQEQKEEKESLCGGLRTEHEFEYKEKKTEFFVLFRLKSFMSGVIFAKVTGSRIVVHREPSGFASTLNTELNGEEPVECKTSMSNME